jgi:hypothetical protein
MPGNMYFLHMQIAIIQGARPHEGSTHTRLVARLPQSPDTDKHHRENRRMS